MFFACRDLSLRGRENDGKSALSTADVKENHTDKYKYDVK